MRNGSFVIAEGLVGVARLKDDAWHEAVTNRHECGQISWKYRMSALPAGSRARSMLPGSRFELARRGACAAPQQYRRLVSGLGLKCRWMSEKPGAPRPHRDRQGPFRCGVEPTWAGRTGGTRHEVASDTAANAGMSPDALRHSRMLFRAHGSATRRSSTYAGSASPRTRGTGCSTSGPTSATARSRYTSAPTFAPCSPPTCAMHDQHARHAPRRTLRARGPPTWAQPSQ